MSQWITRKHRKSGFNRKKNPNMRAGIAKELNYTKHINIPRAKHRQETQKIGIPLERKHENDQQEQTVQKQTNWQEKLAGLNTESADYGVKTSKCGRERRPLSSRGDSGVCRREETEGADNNSKGKEHKTRCQLRITTLNVIIIYALHKQVLLTRN